MKSAINPDRLRNIILSNEKTNKKARKQRKESWEGV